MKGGKNRQPLGYTILEVMIVLAVSGFMFFIATTFINGKQEHTAFTAGVNEMASRLQDTIQQIGAGQYSDIPVICTPSLVPGGPPTFAINAVASQGSQSNCVFVGKFFHFWTSTGVSSYEVFTLAGNRLTATGNPATSLTADVKPVPVRGAGGLDLTVQNTIAQGLELDTTNPGSIKGITVIDAGGASTTPVYGFGFIQNLGSLVTGGSDTGTYNSGGQTINLVYNPSLTAPNLTELQAINTMQNPLAYAKAALICLTDGTQFATISIGDTNSANLNVNAHLLGPTGDATCKP